ncbi:MAG: hypothetical protein QXW10_00475 [Candidatus Micrarchaeaceae archaeon]
MAQKYRISNGKDYVLVTIDDSGAYIIEDSAGRKIFLSKYQAKLMKFGIDNIVGGALNNADSKDIKVEKISSAEKAEK